MSNRERERKLAELEAVVQCVDDDVKHVMVLLDLRGDWE